jgi:magnesium-transporting ATPase (P-type)
MVLSFLGKERIVEVVKVLDFNSTRKRMSIIIKTEKGYELFCKGADNVIEERLDRSGSVNDPAILKMTEDRLNEFSDIGLRTLMVAWRPMNEAEYKAYCSVLDEAENAIDDREERVMEAYETVEKDLIYAGCTAIEDKLQDELPETIEYLLNVRFNLW